jgi:hypothetical protein
MTTKTSILLSLYDHPRPPSPAARSFCTPLHTSPGGLSVLAGACPPSAATSQPSNPDPQKPNIIASPAERVNLAGAALAEAVSQLNPGPQFFRELLSLSQIVTI